jgi:hypothetical protein
MVQRKASYLLGLGLATLGGCGADPRTDSTAQDQAPLEHDDTASGRLPSYARALVGRGSIARLEADGSRLVPRLVAVPSHADSRGARVSLPRHAAGSFRIADARSGMAIEVDLDGAGAADAELIDGLVMYRGALGDGRDVIHRVTVEGAEDYVALATAPPLPELRYTVHLQEGAAGLRLVADTLEILDADGAPRLRVAPPYVVGADGVRRGARLAVDGCAVDESPAAPWGRPVTRPGQTSCVVRVAWDGNVRYPLLVDPAWQATGSMTTPRYQHTSTVFTDGPLKGKVIVAGGTLVQLSQPNMVEISPLATAELYDPKSGTWATTGTMNKPRAGHTATLLKTGRVFVVSGAADDPELYDPSAGTWAWSKTPLPFQHGGTGHTATLLPDGRVLIAGGNYGTSMMPAAQRATDIYDPTTDTWSPGPTMLYYRIGHTATLLSDGTILVAGGTGSNTGPAGMTMLDAVEVLSPSAQIGVLGTPMKKARSGHVAVTMSDGTIFVIGGGDPSFERYSPQTAEWTQAGNLLTDRKGFTADALGNGWILVAGGQSGAALAPTEIYDPSAQQSTQGPPLVTPRYDHTSTMLPDGSVLVAGGWTSNAAGDEIADAERFVLLPLGSPCTSGGTCTSGVCADGVCCNTACDGPCLACSTIKGASHDGTCEPLKKATACGPAACSSGTLSAQQCDGAGTCVDVTENCAPYACAGSPAACRKPCASIDDCAEPNVCTREGVCEAPPAPVREINNAGCACQGAGSGAGEGAASAFAVLVTALAAAGWRRRPMRRARGPRPWTVDRRP